MNSLSTDGSLPSVMLVDDHPIWRQSLRKVVEQGDVGIVVAEAADGAGVTELAGSARPDVVVMDLELPLVDGIEATRRLTAEHPGIKVLVLSASSKRAHVVESVQAGASGYLVKTAGPEEVADAVRRIHAGELVFPPALAHLVLEEFRRRAAGKGAGAEIVPDDVADNAFVREGDLWTLTFAGQVVRLSDLMGLRDISVLLARPGREVHVTDVIAARQGGAVPDASRSRTATGSTADALHVSGLGDAGPILDAKAKTAYRRRLHELREEVEEAESLGDRERAARAADEMAFLAHELAAAMGLGGRDRKAADTAERARVNVTRAIRRAIDHIDEVHPGLARHLDRAITTGGFCSYDPEQPVRWSLR